MAVPVPIEPGNGDGGSSSGGSTAPPGSVPPASGTKLAVLVSGSTCTFTSDQIKAAGGPWTAFRVRVTPINNAGSGSLVEVPYP